MLAESRPLGWHRVWDDVGVFLHVYHGFNFTLVHPGVVDSTVEDGAGVRWRRVDSGVEWRTAARGEIPDASLQALFDEWIEKRRPRGCPRAFLQCPRSGRRAAKLIENGVRPLRAFGPPSELSTSRPAASPRPRPEDRAVRLSTAPRRAVPARRRRVFDDLTATPVNPDGETAPESWFDLPEELRTHVHLNASQRVRPSDVADFADGDD